MNLYNILSTTFCNDNDMKKLFSFIGQIFNIIKIVVPIIIILMGTIDLVKAVVSNNDNMKKAQTTFVKRLIIGVVIFLVPTFTAFIMNLAGEKMDNPCVKCFFNPTDKSKCYYTNKKDNKTAEENSNASLEELENSGTTEKITNSAAND